MRVGYCVLLAALASVGLAAAQQPPARPQSPRPNVLQPATPAAPAAPAQSVTQRMEIFTFDNWKVTCRDPEKAGDKRQCSGELFIATGGGDRPTQVVFTWIVGLKDGKLLTVLQVPTGVLIEPAVEILFPQKPARKATFTACEPQGCEAVVAMDEAFVRDALASTTTDVTIQASNGQSLKFSVNLKGFDRAIGEIRK